MSNCKPRKVIAIAGVFGTIVSILLPGIPAGKVMAIEPAQLNLPIAQTDDALTARQLDGIADRIFNERHPELRGRTIRPGETWLAQEWLDIRSCEAVVDYTFYQRHPELGGRKIRPDETDLAREWQEIRNNYYGCH
jgi:hypothetical protein